MQSKPLLIISVFFLLFISACSKDPAEKYNSYMEKANELKEYKIVYKMEMSAFKVFGLGEMRIGLFKKNDNEKSVVEASVMGQSITASVYNVNGKMIVCSKDPFNPDGKPVCAKDKTNEFSQILDYTTITSNMEPGNTEVSSIGNGEYIGKKCDKFSIDIKNISILLNMSDQQSMLSSSSDLNSIKTRIEVCIDRKTGLGLYIKMYSFSKSELEDNDVENEILSMTATSFADKVDDSIFILPVKYGILGSACDNKEIIAVVDPYADMASDSKINVMGDSFSKKISNVMPLNNKNFQKGKISIVQASLPENNPPYPSYEICLGDDCQNLPCAFGVSVNCIKKSNDKQTCESDKGCIYSDGLCKQFSCYDLKDKGACNSKNCYWDESYGIGQCADTSCYNFKTQNECESSDLTCGWYESQGYTSCNPKSCYDFTVRELCESSNLKCEWKEDPGYPGYCNQKNCLGLSTKESCESSDLNCKWLSDQYGSYCTI
ncbi:MAG: hypothetical protein AABX00_05430 [Nanoarchaeota archaeon]